MAADYTPIEVPTMPLLAAGGTSPKSGGLVLAFQPDRLWLDGVQVVKGAPIDSPTAIARLRTNVRLIEAVKRGSTIYLAVAPDVNWNQLTRVLVGAGIKGGRLGFLFGKKRGLPAPKSSKLSLHVKGKRSLAETGPAMAKAFAPCAPLTKVLRDIALTGEVTPEVLAPGIAEAVQSCDCAVGTDVVRTALWSMFHGDEPTYSVATVSLVSGAPGPSVAVFAHDDKATWKDVAQKMRKVAATATPQVAFATLRPKIGLPSPAQGTNN